MSPSPTTLLTLRLSSPSFLETILTDNNQPVYSTETSENTTSLFRCHPYHGLTPVANIHWPKRASPKGKGKDFSSAQIFMDGSLTSEDDLLKRNCLNTYVPPSAYPFCKLISRCSSRKFRIPGHSGALKWRRVQGVFQCVTSSGTPVAVFEPPILTARARMHVFVPTLSGLPEIHSGVSSVLVDYLIVTVLLLITHPEDWHGFAPSPVSHPVDLPSLTQLQIPYTRPSTASTPSSPLSPSSPSTSDTSYYTSSTPVQIPTPATPSPCWEPRRDLRRLASSVDFTPTIKEEICDLEPPPPYEEIQWTVRVRQPRRPRTSH
ncbi:hypothetical protein BU17DRAFT_88953 [Hysterangium stoloniferum]|nr:hypothetical protein BU17DRAFT_88953 [Hysterangium stoloniferum]